jgi:uncharacterized protein YbaR (Trm112 family)
MSEELTLLACTQCGGKLKVDETTIEDAFMYVDEDTFVYIGGSAGNSSTLTCEHCGHSFERREQVKRHADGHVAVVKGSGAIAQGSGALAVGAGGVVIGGSAKNSTIITGKGNTVTRKGNKDDEDGVTVIITN